MTPSGVWVLWTMIGVMSVSDIWTRTIPLWLTGPALVVAWGGAWGGAWTWSPWAAGCVWLMVRWASLPPGDQKALAVVGGFVGVEGMAWALAGACGCWVGLLTRWGPRAAGWPFFPWMAGWLGVVTYVRNGGLLH